MPLTSNLKWAEAPGNVLLTAKATGLREGFRANVSLIVALDNNRLTERTGKLPRRSHELILSGIDIVLGR